MEYDLHYNWNYNNTKRDHGNFRRMVILHFQKSEEAHPKNFSSMSINTRSQTHGKAALLVNAVALTPISILTSIKMMIVIYVVDSCESQVCKSNICSRL